MQPLPSHSNFVPINLSQGTEPRLIDELDVYVKEINTKNKSEVLVTLKSALNKKSFKDLNFDEQDAVLRFISEANRFHRWESCDYESLEKLLDFSGLPDEDVVNISKNFLLEAFREVPFDKSGSLKNQFQKRLHLYLEVLKNIFDMEKEESEFLVKYIAMQTDKLAYRYQLMSFYHSNSALDKESLTLMVTTLGSLQELIDELKPLFKKTINLSREFNVFKTLQNTILESSLEFISINSKVSKQEVYFIFYLLLDNKIFLNETQQRIHNAIAKVVSFSENTQRDPFPNFLNYSNQFDLWKDLLEQNAAFSTVLRDSILSALLTFITERVTYGELSWGNFEEFMKTKLIDYPLNLDHFKSLIQIYVEFVNRHLPFEKLHQDFSALLNLNKMSSEYLSSSSTWIEIFKKLSPADFEKFYELSDKFITEPSELFKLHLFLLHLSHEQAANKNLEVSINPKMILERTQKIISYGGKKASFDQRVFEDMLKNSKINFFLKIKLLQQSLSLTEIKSTELSALTLILIDSHKFKFSELESLLKQTVRTEGKESLELTLELLDDFLGLIRDLEKDKKIKILQALSIKIEGELNKLQSPYPEKVGAKPLHFAVLQMNYARKMLQELQKGIAQHIKQLQ